MKLPFRSTTAIAACLIVLGVVGLDRCFAASTTVEQALKLVPVQQGVDYDRPTPEEAAKCKISVKKDDGRVGWVVESPDGLILRKFIDTNGDNVVDQWSYYKDGVEVYRDVDSDFNGKPDQYRWLNAGGTRWGVDNDANGAETGKIGYWKAISAEEVTAEAVAALATHDVERFTQAAVDARRVADVLAGQGQKRSLGGETGQSGKQLHRLAQSADQPCPGGKMGANGRRRPGTVPAEANGPARTCEFTKASSSSCRRAIRPARCRSAR